MNNDITPIRFGLLLAMITLMFGIGMGILFGTKEDAVKSYISDGIAQHSTIHDEKSQAKIWRYAQRAHFHSTGVGAFTLGLIMLTGFTSMSRKAKVITSTLIGFGGFYSLSWFTMFILAPSMGRSAAHHALITESITIFTIGCLLLGILSLLLNLMFGFGEDRKPVLPA